MSIFGNDKIADLTRQVKELKERLATVEAAVEPFRISELDFGFHWVRLNWTDPRTAVSHARAIQMLFDHLGLLLTKIPGTPEQIILEKKGKAK